jgi:hypothetical protein
LANEINSNVSTNGIDEEDNMEKSEDIVKLDIHRGLNVREFDEVDIKPLV